ncbi:MAG: hypothetical protein LBH93_04405 [Chitinispirillales bacterium]|jgi:hypothetical protein|nr:hypothetical protein [Chitinispirillales bacterium]
MRNLAEEEHRSVENTVKILVCDSTVNICKSNPRAEKVFCVLCRNYRKHLFSRLPKDIEVLHYKDFYLPENKLAVDSLRFDYDSAQEIKALTYKNVKIGYGAFSTYVTLTRNLYPETDGNFRRYFNQYLKAECILIELLGNVLDKVRPDKVSLYNGRHFETRPVLELAKSLGYTTRCYENIRTGGSVRNRNYICFENAFVHGIKPICDLIRKTWDESNLPEDEKQMIGDTFFANKRGSLYAGDRVYTKKQKYGSMPDGFDKSKRNIAIFTSSEDEFASIDSEYDDDQVFASQQQGIAEILEHFKNNTNFHFYLRVHPNLKNVKYRYHTSLLKLGDIYNNVTVIKAGDEISSYSLLENVEKVVVFGSTIGVEAAYWGKPVILLCAAFYKYLDICYKPENAEEAFSLIEADGLRIKDKTDALKYGFYSMYERNSKSVRCDSQGLFKVFREIAIALGRIRLFGGMRIPMKEKATHR